MYGRNEIIIERILSGEKYVDLAVEFGVTKQRIQQIYRKYVADKAYNESTSDLERLIIKTTGHGFNYQALMTMICKSEINTLEDLLNTSTEDILLEKNRRTIDNKGNLIIFCDTDFYRKHIESMKKKAIKIIAKREKESY